MSTEDISEQERGLLGNLKRRTALKTGTAMAAAIALGGASTGVGAAANDERYQPQRPPQAGTFLLLDGIEGDLSAPAGAIEVVSWEWGGETPDDGTGGTVGQTQFDTLTVGKHIDEASPLLWEQMTLGGHITGGELIVRDAGGQETVSIAFEGVRVTSISTGGTIDEHPETERVTLRITDQFIITVGDEEFGWDLQSQTALE